MTDWAGGGGHLIQHAHVVLGQTEVGFASWRLRIAEGQPWLRGFITLPEALVLNPGLITPNRREQMWDLCKEGLVGADGPNAEDAVGEPQGTPVLRPSSGPR